MQQVDSVAGLGERILRMYGGSRLIVGVAGAPGSGKSTLAEALETEINRARPGLAAVLPMDGYHYDNAVLSELGRLARKGSPDTFDVGGLTHMLHRLSTNDEETIAVPVFDRTIETARAGARLIPQSVGIVITEGNYLLLKRPPWNRLEGLFDFTVMIDVPTDVLRQRLEARWRHFGLSEAQVRHKVDVNDQPNGRLVIDESRPADCLFTGGIAVSGPS